MSEDNKDRPVYMISIAAKLSGMHPQTLRIYERKKLVQPGRTAKSTRLYSDRDIERLKYIQQLTQDEGVNLAGVRIIMDLQRRVAELMQTMSELEKQLEKRQREMNDNIQQVHRSYRRELVWVPRGEIVKVKGS